MSCTSEDARAYTGASLLVDSLQAKQESAPTEFGSHLHRNVVGVVGEPGPDGAFALERTGGCLGSDTHGAVSSRRDLDSLSGFDVGRDLRALAAVTDQEDIRVVGLQRQGCEVVESADHIGDAGGQIVFHTLCLTRLEVFFIE